jgi:hypothetical protein
MSNVLIGIIGVILFIGLALAGALILGDDFKSSKASTGAATTISQLQQTAAAVNMYQLKTGRTMMANDYLTNVDTLVPRFLKVSPRTPTANQPVFTVDDQGFGRAVRVHHLQSRLGLTASVEAKAVCREIESQNGAADPDAAIAAVTTTSGWATRVAASKGVGCFLYTAGTDPGYYAFLLI